MKQRLPYIILFLILNFAALGLGVYLMGGEPLSDWYTQLNQAPWTPPNPVFGIAWSVIMVCFAVYMTHLIKHRINPSFIWIIYTIQWTLNTGWNYVFFNQHQPFLGLVTILLLFSIVCFLLFKFYRQLKWRSLWILPYVAWLIVAISLNAYIVVYNS